MAQRAKFLNIPKHTVGEEFFVFRILSDFMSFLHYDFDSKIATAGCRFLHRNKCEDKNNKIERFPVA